MIENTPIQFLVIHCSATPKSLEIGAYEIDKMHRLERGFDRIGYHWVIKRDGTIEKGREEKEIGAHAYGYNKGSLGICLVGGLSDLNEPENNFTPNQFESLYRLLKQLKENYPDAKILGHRDLPNVQKQCPCFDVIPWWSTKKALKGFGLIEETSLQDSLNALPDKRLNPFFQNSSDKS